MSNSLKHLKVQSRTNSTRSKAERNVSKEGKVNAKPVVNVLTKKHINTAAVEGWEILQLFDGLLCCQSGDTPAGFKSDINIFDLNKFSPDRIEDSRMSWILHTPFFKDNSVLLLPSMNYNKVYSCLEKLDPFDYSDKFDIDDAAMLVSRMCNLVERSTGILIVKSDVIIETLMFQRAQILIFIDFDPLQKFYVDSWLSSFFQMLLFPKADFVPYAKYITAYPLARYLKNELPKKPQGFPEGYSLLFSGGVRVFLKNRLASFGRNNLKFTKRFIAFCLGYLQGVKRACARVSYSYIQQAYEKHKLAMQKESKIDDFGHLDYFRQFSSYFCDNFKCLKKKLYTPSTSAHYESSFDEYGAYGYIMKRTQHGVSDENFIHTEIPVYVELEDSNSKTDILEEINVQSESDLLKVDSINSTERKKVVIDGSYEEIGLSSNTSEDADLSTIHLGSNKLQYMEFVPQLNKTVQYRGPDILMKNSINTLRSMILEDNSNLSKALPEDFIETLEFPESHMLTVKTYAISEPLKVRMITKGQALPYYYSKFFQKSMFKYLRTFPQFTLIGEPVSNTHVEEILEQELYLKENFFLDLGFTDWVSGDYSAATDSIKSQYTMIAFEAFLARSDLDETDQNILRASLYNSYVEYPGDRPGAYYKQTRGQLMGSILSFPILCMINLIGYAIALKKYLAMLGFHHPIPLNRLPVKVNGDDILFRTNKVFYQYWLDSISQIGFSLSIGKNYVHKNIMTINSVCYYYDSQTHFISKIDYLNVGLLTGQSKLRVRQSKELLPIDDWYNSCMSGANEKLIIHKFFLHFHKDRIKKLTENGKYNLFTSKYLGGLGFNRYPEIPVSFTDFQIHLASFLYQRFVSFLGTPNEVKKLLFRPLVGQSFLKTKTMEDHSRYGLLLLPNSFKNEIYDENLHIRDLVNPLFLWSSQGFFNRSDVSIDDDVLNIKPVKDNFWKKFNKEYNSLNTDMFSLNLDWMEHQWHMYFVPLSEMSSD